MADSQPGKVQTFDPSVILNAYSAETGHRFLYNENQFVLAKLQEGQTVLDHWNSGGVKAVTNILEGEDYVDIAYDKYDDVYYAIRFNDTLSGSAPDINDNFDKLTGVDFDSALWEEGVGGNVYFEHSDSLGQLILESSGGAGQLNSLYGLDGDFLTTIDLINFVQLSNDDSFFCLRTQDFTLGNDYLVSCIKGPYTPPSTTLVIVPQSTVSGTVVTSGTVFPTLELPTGQAAIALVSGTGNTIIRTTPNTSFTIPAVPTLVLTYPEAGLSHSTVVHRDGIPDFTFNQPGVSVPILYTTISDFSVDQINNVTVTSENTITVSGTETTFTTTAIPSTITATGIAETIPIPDFDANFYQKANGDVTFNLIGEDPEILVTATAGVDITISGTPISFNLTGTNVPVTIDGVNPTIILVGTNHSVSIPINPEITTVVSGTTQLVTPAGTDLPITVEFIESTVVIPESRFIVNTVGDTHNVSIDGVDMGNIAITDTETTITQSTSSSVSVVTIPPDTTLVTNLTNGSSVYIDDIDITVNGTSGQITIPSDPILPRHSLFSGVAQNLNATNTDRHYVIDKDDIPPPIYDIDNLQTVTVTSGVAVDGTFAAAVVSYTNTVGGTARIKDFTLDPTKFDFDIPGNQAVYQMTYNSSSNKYAVLASGVSYPDATPDVLYTSIPSASFTIEHHVLPTTPANGQKFTVAVSTAQALISNSTTVSGIQLQLERVGSNGYARYKEAGDVGFTTLAVGNNLPSSRHQVVLFADSSGSPIDIAADNFTASADSVFYDTAVFSVITLDKSGDIVPVTNVSDGTYPGYAIRRLDLIKDLNATYSDFSPTLSGVVGIATDGVTEPSGELYIKVKDSLYRYTKAALPLDLEDGATAVTTTTGEIPVKDIANFSFNGFSGGGLNYIKFEPVFGGIFVKTVADDTLLASSKKVFLDIEHTSYKFAWNVTDLSTLYYVDQETDPGNPALLLYDLNETKAAFVNVSSSKQVLSAGTAETAAISAQVLNVYGETKSAKSVTFSVSAGDGAVSPVTGCTDVNGYATTTYTVGSAVGTATITVSVSDIACTP